MAGVFFFPIFVVLANFILLQLVVAAMLEFLKACLRLPVYLGLCACIHRCMRPCMHPRVYICTPKTWTWRLKLTCETLHATTGPSTPSHREPSRDPDKIPRHLPPRTHQARLAALAI